MLCASIVENTSIARVTRIVFVGGYALVDQPIVIRVFCAAPPKKFKKRKTDTGFEDMHTNKEAHLRIPPYSAPCTGT